MSYPVELTFFSLPITHRILEGRDPDYQKLAIKGLLGGSKRVLGGTKNDDKIKAIKDGVALLEAWLEVFDKENRGKLNLAYLPFTTITAMPATTNKLAAEFIEVYGGPRVKGNYKHLRTLFPEDDDSKSWDIVRNRELKVLKDKMAKDNGKLFGADGAPTELHLQMIYWAYSPQSDKVKSYAANLKPVKSAEKRKSAAPSSSSSDDIDDSDSTDDIENQKAKSAPAKKHRSK